MSKKVFISYSWGNDEHQQWIVDLGTRLMSDTVDVILDRWSLKDGHDIHSFMEEMVKAEDIFRVLIVSNKKYTDKADSREGGVGTETQIITPNIYSKEKQEKFIPIVLERDAEGEPYLPVYLKSRKYIDFSRVENFENSYEELLRNILEAPSLAKPRLGSKPPTYITDSTINLSETNNKLKFIENQFKKNNTIPTRDMNDFVEIFFDKLWEFDPAETSADLKEFGEQLLDGLKSYKPLREDFIQLVELLSISGDENADEMLKSFFEHASVYQYPRLQQGTWSASRFDIFKIIFHELYIYTVAICLKNKSYRLLADLLYSRYYKVDIYDRNKEPQRFTFLRTYHQNLESYFSTFYNKVTGFGEYMITNLSGALKKQDIISADMLCYFVSCLESKESYDMWFPCTCLYSDHKSFSFFDKMTSEKHFNNSRILFNVETKEEFKALIVDYKNRNTVNGNQPRIGYSSIGYSYIPFIYELVNPETIGIYR